MSRFTFFVGVVLLASGCSRSTPPAKEPKSTKAAEPVAVAPGAPSPQRLAQGKAVFVRTCATCHQPDGAGVKGIFPPIDPEIVSADPVRLIRVVLHGLQGQLTVAGVNYNSVMPPQGAMLKDHEIANVLTYVRHTWGNQASPIEPETVAAERAKTKRTTMWTWAELNSQ